MHVHVHTVIDFVNEADTLIEKLQLIGELAPLIDEAPLDQKARLGVGLLGLVQDYAHELSALSDAFAERLPRRSLVELGP